MNGLGKIASVSLDKVGIHSTGSYANRTWSLNIVTTSFQFNPASPYRPMKIQVLPDRPKISKTYFTR
jgi:hypothetical protein